MQSNANIHWYNRIHKDMQVDMDLHKYAKVYKVDIPGYTQIY